MDALAARRDAQRAAAEITPNVAHDPSAPALAVDRLAGLSSASPGSALSVGRCHPRQPTTGLRLGALANSELFRPI
jgi:hypothetical protein